MSVTRKRRRPKAAPKSKAKAPTQAPTLYTIGHSRHGARHFLEVLRAQRIERLVDVRSRPASRWAPHYGKAALERLLREHAIEYVFLGRELGGRPEGAEFYRADGALDLARRRAAPDFRAGIERLVGLAGERRTVILCAEEDPARCHRRHLVAPELRQAGFAIVHIRGDAELETEE